MDDYARILVVDGDPSLLRATSRLLAGAGYKVVQAATGSEGLHLAGKERPDLILLEVVLPDLDGLEVCQRIKADAELAGSHVILMSATRATTDNQAEGLEGSADAYIARSISSRELLARVEAQLRLKRMEDTLRERTHQLDQRIRELNCLHGISQLREQPGISLEEILQRTVNLIPLAFQHPAVACARLLLEGQEFRTANFRETVWQQASELKVWEAPAGWVEVYYSAERLETHDGPFLQEEQRLLDAIAERLGKIIERWQMQDALREAEERYRTLSELTSDLAYAFRVEPDGTLVREWMTDALSRLTGFTSEELAAHGGWAAVIHRDDLPTSRRHIEALLSGQQHTIQLRIVTKDGEVRWLEDHGRPVWDEAQARVVCIYGRARDITERKQAEAALQESEGTARALLNAPTDIAVLLDTRGFVLDANETFAQRFHRSAEELIGLHVWELFPPDVAERRKAFVEQVIESRKPVRFEDEREGIWNDSVVYPICDEQGQVTKIAVLARDITERKQAEQALRESEEKYRSIIEQSFDGIRLVDSHGTILEWNEGCERITGCTKDTVLGKPIWEVLFQLLPDERRSTSAYERLKAGGLDFLSTGQAPWHGPGQLITIQRPDGTRRFIEELLFPVEINDRLVGCSICRDVTEWVQAEEALADTTQLLETILDHTHMLVAYLDPQFNFVRVNSAYAAADDREPSFFTGKNHFDLYPNAENEQIFRRVVETGQPYLAYAKPFEYAEHPERGVSYWDWGLVPIRDRDGTVAGLVMTLADVTHRLETSQALRDSQEQLALVIDHVPAMICYVDADLRYVYANSAYAEWYGLSKEELIGRHLSETVDEGAYQMAAPYYEAVLQGQVVSFENIAPDRNGQMRTVSVTLVPHFDDQGQVKAFVGMLQDITERARTELLLQEKEEKLRTVFELLPIGLAVLDRDRNTMISNQALAEIIGLPDGELQRGRYRKRTYLRPDGTEMPAQEFASTRAINEQQVIRGIETGVLKEDGELVWTSVNAAPVPFPDWATVVTTVDITERKRMEETLRQSEQELRIRNRINNIFLTYPDEEMYAELLKLIRTIMGSEYGTFGYFDDDGSFVAPALTRQIYWDKCNVPQKEIIFQKGTFGGIWGRAIKERKILIANEGPFQTPEGHIPIQNTMVTPIVFHDEVISTFHLANKSGGYDEQDRAMAEMIATKIAPVLYARLQRDRRDRERQRAEEALRQSEERYRLLLESTSDSVYVLDHEWRHVVVNDAAARFVQMPKETLLGNKLMELFPGIEETVFFQTFRRVMETRQPGTVTAEYDFPDGRKGWYEVRVDPAPEGILCISRDITDRKQAEEALRESEEKYRDLVENINDVIYELDADGELTYISPAVESLLGYQEQDMLGRHFTRYVSPDDVQLMGEQLQQLRSGGIPGPSEYRVVTKSGVTRWIRTSSQPKVVSDRITGVRGVLTDVTEQVEADQRLKAALAEKETLLKEIHHRVKNNLQLISAMLDLQARTTTDEQVIQAFEESQHRILSMAGIHEQLYGSKDLSHVDMSAYVQDLATDLQRSYGRPAINFRTEVSKVTLDIDRAIPCGLIVNELVSNALKHAFPPSREQDGEVQITLCPSPLAEGKVVLAVSDNGIGLPASVQPEQAETLGLTMVSLLTRQLGGTLELDRSDGTTFRVTFAS